MHRAALEKKILAQPMPALRDEIDQNAPQSYRRQVCEFVRLLDSGLESTNSISVMIKASYLNAMLHLYPEMLP